MIRTADAYRAGLSDGRRVFYRGAAVKDVVADPELRVAVDHSAIAFDLAHDLDPTIRRLAVDVVDGEECSAFYAVPRSAEDLTRRSRLIETAARRGSGMIVLKEVGSDALFGLLRSLHGPGLERAAAFHRRCQQYDLAVAVAQTDVKGDRSLPPHRQPDPDHYVHIVDEDSDSIVVRGAKCHTSVTPNADELVVLPTRAMIGDDADYAVSFAVPIDTPGLSMYVSSYSAGERNPFEFPISSQHKMLETLTVFDDVIVPKERVFLCREPEQAGPLALAFVDYHRFTAISYKLPLLDLLVGAATLVAEANGIGRAGHVRDKLAQLIAYAETVRGLSQLAASRAEVDDRGMARPDPLTVNMAKYTFAHGFSDAVARLIDLAGGLLVTGPGGEDWDNPEIRPVLEKYFAAAVPAEERLRIIHLISDLTARDFGGYHAVLAAHAEGSLEAEKLQLLRSYDAGPAAAYARELARI
jgi:4-hydroxybutyryl-CoA dehydratase / vinylacetyl-CoA-Delta-isomerase